MLQKTVFRYIAWPGLLGGLLLCHERVWAQPDEAVRLEPNEQVIRSWQQNNLGSASPELKREEDGSTRLEWKGSASTDIYSNDVSSASGLVIRPVRSVSFF
ncbi:MAG: hypothetical protein JWQ72_204 [Polaromonas sp.]|nr:hypothetical protein [Polaromonas sp.]